MKTRRIALSAAALILGLAGALVGNSHASADTGMSFESIAGLQHDVEMCIGVSSPYAVLKTCSYSATDIIWQYGPELGTTGFYQYENNNGQCLSVYGGGDSLNERIGAGTCNTSHPDQFWTLNDLGGGSYNIVNYHSSYPIQIYNNSLANGAALVQYYATTSPYQKWSIQPQS